MSAKEVKFAADARDRMVRGADILANAVRITLGPKGLAAGEVELTPRATGETEHVSLSAVVDRVVDEVRARR